jgi:hypothetical protein
MLTYADACRYTGDRVSTPPEYAADFSEGLLLLPLPYLATSLPRAQQVTYAGVSWRMQTYAGVC